MRSLFSALGFLAATASALNTIEVNNQEFIDSKTGDRFMIIGVDYQPGGQDAYGTGAGDPLSNPKACLRDAALMQDMGINTIRIYNLDSSLNHDECVSIFNSVGIYMIIDVNSPLSGESIDRSDPSSSYHKGYLNHIFTVVEAFKDYPNTLGFFAGNEIINDIGTAKENPQYIRAVQRDLKNYIKNNANRAIPVGYSAADVREVLEDTWAYLQCQIGSGVDMSRSDFFGLNSYSWCGDASSFTISEYDKLVLMFGNSTIPVFFSEYGCNDPQPRLFDEVPTLYGPQMTVMSGGLVYEWSQEPSDYGLVQINDDGSIKLLADFNVLRDQYNSLDINLIRSENTTATSLTPPDCDSSLITEDGFSTNFNIPDTPPGGDELINNGIRNPPSGSIVEITETAVQVAVVQTDGSRVKNLQIRPGATEANFPGAVSGFATASGSGGGASATSRSSKGAAAAPTAAVIGNAVTAAALGAVAFAL
ncbi:Glycolipid anchored surface protein 4 precursor [Vermiconidia calcicola]|uniref:Glycolipid anchored surface protein 4 n=1 Tax=Vermiconidia calcicola TaxID=1690605 RepID=A0ACC3MBE5_9PEZI|nr:Glycolipid anchored surface protein 4 precursor [Vermiconidia calcicola]